MKEIKSGRELLDDERIANLHVQARRINERAKRLQEAAEEWQRIAAEGRRLASAAMNLAECATVTTLETAAAQRLHARKLVDDASLHAVMRTPLADLKRHRHDDDVKRLLEAQEIAAGLIEHARYRIRHQAWTAED